MKPLFEKVLLSEASFLIKEEHFNRFDISLGIFIPSLSYPFFFREKEK